MTKRLASLAVVAAAAASFALPAAPASASDCISYFTTPVDCALEAYNRVIQSCIQGTQIVCLPAGS